MSNPKPPKPKLTRTHRMVSRGGNYKVSIRKLRVQPISHAEKEVEGWWKDHAEEDEEEEDVD